MNVIINITRTISWGQSEDIAKKRVTIPPNENVNTVVDPIIEEIIQDHINKNDGAYPRNKYNSSVYLEHNNLYYILIDKSGRKFDTF